MQQQHVFSLPARPELAAGAKTLFAKVDGASVDETRTYVRALASEYVDSIVDGMILAFISPADAGTRTESLIKNLASVIKSVSHGLVRSATSGAKKDELDKMIAYVKKQLVLDEVRPSIDFVLAPGTRDGFATVIASRHGDGLPGQRAKLLETMLAFTDEALQHYLVGPFALLDLGFLTRKAFDVGHTTIRAGARSAIQHSLGADGADDFTHLVDFFDRTIVRA